MSVSVLEGLLMKMVHGSRFNFQIIYLQIYRELEDTNTHKVVYSSVTAKGPLHGVPVNEIYRPLGVIDRKRLAARKTNTTYCYDFPLVSHLVTLVKLSFLFVCVFAPSC